MKCRKDVPVFIIPFQDHKHLITLLHTLGLQSIGDLTAQPSDVAKSKYSFFSAMIGVHHRDIIRRKPGHLINNVITEVIVVSEIQFEIGKQAVFINGSRTEVLVKLHTGTPLFCGFF